MAAGKVEQGFRAALLHACETAMACKPLHALQGAIVQQAWGNAPRNSCFTPRSTVRDQTLKSPGRASLLQATTSAGSAHHINLFFASGGFFEKYFLMPLSRASAI